MSEDQGHDPDLAVSVPERETMRAREAADSDSSNDEQLIFRKLVRKELSDICLQLHDSIRRHTDEQFGLLRDEIQRLVNDMGRTTLQAPPPAPLVLLVDDYDEMRRGLARELELAGFRVRHFGGASEAYALLATVEIDVAIVDLHLSDGESGMGLLRDVRADYPDVSCVVLTGYHLEEGQRAELDELGARLLEKPFAIDRLIRTIQELRGLRVVSVD